MPIYVDDRQISPKGLGFLVAVWTQEDIEEMFNPRPSVTFEHDGRRYVVFLDTAQPRRSHHVPRKGRR